MRVDEELDMMLLVLRLIFYWVIGTSSPESLYSGRCSRSVQSRVRDRAYLCFVRVGFTTFFPSYHPYPGLRRVVRRDRNTKKVHSFANIVYVSTCVSPQLGQLRERERGGGVGGGELRELGWNAEWQRVVPVHTFVRSRSWKFRIHIRLPSRSLSHKTTIFRFVESFVRFQHLDHT